MSSTLQSGSGPLGADYRSITARLEQLEFKLQSCQIMSNARRGCEIVVPSQAPNVLSLWYFFVFKAYQQQRGRNQNPTIHGRKKANHTAQFAH